MVLSLRLQAVLDFLQGTNVLADIGTDHAYLPIEACKLDLCKTAIACDINKGPLEIANANINAAGLNARIQTRLGDGLKPLNRDEADSIVISGMGGMRIWNILKEETEKARFAKKLILQPQHDLEELRRKLHSEGFTISAEKLVQEDSRFYIIQLAHYSGDIEAWTPEEYFLGKTLHESPAFLPYLRHQQDKINRYIHAIHDKTAAKMQLKWIGDRL